MNKRKIIVSTVITVVSIIVGMICFLLGLYTQSNILFAVVYIAFMTPCIVIHLLNGIFDN